MMESIKYSIEFKRRRNKPEIKLSGNPNDVLILSYFAVKNDLEAMLNEVEVNPDNFKKEITVLKSALKTIKKLSYSKAKEFKKTHNKCK
jgi:hypothetical protein